MTGADVASRLRDAVRDSKIRQDCFSQLQKTSILVHGAAERDFPRYTASEQEFWKHSGITSSNEDVESWFLEYMEKEAPSLGVYRQNTESESIIIRFRRNLSVYDGFWHIEDLLSWIDAIDDFFEETCPPERIKCKIVWSKMKGRAYYWWKQLQQERIEHGKEEINSWPKMKNLVISRFTHSLCSKKCLAEVHGNSNCEANVGNNNIYVQCSNKKAVCNESYKMPSRGVDEPYAEIIRKHEEKDVCDGTKMDKFIATKCLNIDSIKMANNDLHLKKVAPWEEEQPDDVVDTIKYGDLADNVANKTPLVPYSKFDHATQGAFVFEENIVENQKVLAEQEANVMVNDLNIGSQANDASNVLKVVLKWDLKLRVLCNFYTARHIRKVMSSMFHILEDFQSQEPIHLDSQYDGVGVNEMLIFLFDPGGPFKDKLYWFWRHTCLLHNISLIRSNMNTAKLNRAVVRTAFDKGPWPKLTTLETRNNESTEIDVPMSIGLLKYHTDERQLVLYQQLLDSWVIGDRGQLFGALVMLNLCQVVISNLSARYRTIIAKMLIMFDPGGHRRSIHLLRCWILENPFDNSYYVVGTRGLKVRLNYRGSRTQKEYDLNDLNVSAYAMVVGIFFDVAPTGFMLGWKPKFGFECGKLVELKCDRKRRLFGSENRTISEAKMIHLSYIASVWKVPWNVALEKSMNDIIHMYFTDNAPDSLMCSVMVILLKSGDQIDCRIQMGALWLHAVSHLTNVRAIFLGSASLRKVSIQLTCNDGDKSFGTFIAGEKFFLHDKWKEKFKGSETYVLAYENLVQVYFGQAKEQEAKGFVDSMFRNRFRPC